MSCFVLGFCGFRHKSGALLRTSEGYFTGTKLTAQNENARTLLTASPITQHGKRPGLPAPHPTPPFGEMKPPLSQVRSACRLLPTETKLSINLLARSVRRHATHSSMSKSSVFVDLDRLLFNNVCGICETNTTGTSISLLCTAPAQSPGDLFHGLHGHHLVPDCLDALNIRSCLPELRLMDLDHIFPTGTCGTCKNWKTGAPTIHCAASVLAGADDPCSSMEASVEYASEIAAATC